MISPILLLILFWLAVFYLYRYSQQRPHNFPPGPPRLPLWGSYWWVLFNDYMLPFKGFQKLAQKYKTQILGLHLGPYPTVVVHDYEHVRQVLTRPEFQGRVQLPLLDQRTFDKNLGIMFTEGPFWEDQRRFSLRYLRDFGLGRRFDVMENIIAEEIQDMVNLLDGRRKDERLFKDGLALVPNLFFPLFLNTLWSMFVGDRLHVSDSDTVHNLYTYAMRHQKAVEVTGGAVGLTLWLKHISSYFGYEDLVGSAKYLLKNIDNALSQQTATHSEDYTRNFADMYIKRMNEDKKTGEPSFFSEEQMRVVMLDYILPGSTTPNAVMAFLVAYMINYPDVQLKMQQELDAVVGRDRVPTLDDRANLPYNEAVIREVMRLRPVTPLGVGRKTLEDAELGGYNIPKGTGVLVHLWSSQRDPKIWDDPLTFRPERYLDSNGQLIKKDCAFPFGGGKRLCVGETSSRHYMFVLLTTLLQIYNFKGAPGKPLPTIDPDLSGIMITKKPFWARFEPRT